MRAAARATICTAAWLLIMAATVAAQDRGCPTDTSEHWIGLPVCEETVNRVGYDRSEFGGLYRAKERYLVAALPQADGMVETPYTCARFPVLDDGTAATDIEHIVSLAEAYDSGLDERLFRVFAGDSDNLTIAAPDVNRWQKGARDAGEWIPPRNQHWFALNVIAVKRKYHLSIDHAERDALAGLLAGKSELCMVR